MTSLKIMHCWQSEEAVEWNGEYSAPAENVLQQHVAQSSMTDVDEALAQWVEYAVIGQSHTISCQTFFNILQRLTRPIANGLLTDEEVCGLRHKIRQK